MKKLLSNPGTYIIALILLWFVCLLNACQKSEQPQQLRIIEVDSFAVPSYSAARGGVKGKPKPQPEDTVIVTPPPIPAGQGVLIYINMDGQMVNDVNWYSQEVTQQPFYAPPADLTADQKQVVVSDAVRAFDKWKVTVTTDRFVYQNSMLPKINIIVTPYTFKPGGSGFAFVGSMFYGTPEIAFVFTEQLFNYDLYIGKIVTHEAGHTIGLRHQTTYNPDCTLYSRYAEGAKMGAHWSTEGVWKYGTTYACNVYQDDEKVMTEKIGLR